MTIDKSLPTELGYHSQRAGNVLYVEYAAQIPADLSPYSVIKFKRGIDITYDLQILSGKDYLAYGDSSLPKPIIRRSNPDLTIESNGVNDALIADLDLRGGRRGLSFYSGSNIEILRCHLEGNTAHANAQGIYAKYVNGLKILQCTSANTQGDVIYGTGCSNVNIEYNDFGATNGAAGDGIEFSHENKAGQRNSNIIIRNNIIRTDDLSNSGKGAIVVEGTDGYEISYNDVEGQYFGISLSGTDGEIFENTVHGQDMVQYPYGFGIGIGTAFPTDNVSIYGNRIFNCNRGVIVSAPNPANPPLITNIGISNNEFIDCGVDTFVNIPYTGTIE